MSWSPTNYGESCKAYYFWRFGSGKACSPPTADGEVAKTVASKGFWTQRNVHCQWGNLKTYYNITCEGLGSGEMFTYNDGSCSLVGFEAEKGSLTMGVAEKSVSCGGFRSGEISTHDSQWEKLENLSLVEALEAVKVL